MLNQSGGYYLLFSYYIEMFYMGQSHQIQSRSSPGPNLHFSCLASMPKINRNAFTLPRKPCSYCPSCQTFCKHHRTCQRGPPRATASVQTLIHRQLPVNTWICFYERFSVEMRTFVPNCKSHKEQDMEKPDIWNNASKHGSQTQRLSLSDGAGRPDHTWLELHQYSVTKKRHKKRVPLDICVTK